MTADFETVRATITSYFRDGYRDGLAALDRIEQRQRELDYQVDDMAKDAAEWMHKCEAAEARVRELKAALRDSAELSAQLERGVLNSAETIIRLRGNAEAACLAISDIDDPHSIEDALAALKETSE